METRDNVRERDTVVTGKMDNQGKEKKERAPVWCQRGRREEREKMQGIERKREGIRVARQARFSLSIRRARELCEFVEKERIGTIRETPLSVEIVWPLPSSAIHSIFHSRFQFAINRIASFYLPSNFCKYRYIYVGMYVCKST